MTTATALIQLQRLTGNTSVASLVADERRARSHGSQPAVTTEWHPRSTMLQRSPGVLDEVYTWLADVLSGKKTARRAERVARVGELLKEMDDSLETVQGRLGTAEFAAEIANRPAVSEALSSIQDGIRKARKPGQIARATMGNVAKLREAASFISELKKPADLRTKKGRLEFVDSCSNMLALAGKPLESLPWKPISSLAIFFTKAGQLIKGPHAAMEAGGLGASTRSGRSYRKMIEGGRRVMP